MPDEVKAAMMNFIDEAVKEMLAEAAINNLFVTDGADAGADV